MSPKTAALIVFVVYFFVLVQLFVSSPKVSVVLSAAIFGCIAIMVILAG